MKCIFCKNAKQDRKTKTIFSKRRNLHGSDIWRAKKPHYDKPFQKPLYDFTKHPKFTLIDYRFFKILFIFILLW